MERKDSKPVLEVHQAVLHSVRAWAAVDSRVDSVAADSTPRIQTISSGTLVPICMTDSSSLDASPT